MGFYHQLAENYRLPRFSSSEERERFFAFNDQTKHTQRRDFLFLSNLIFVVFGLVDLKMGGSNSDDMLRVRFVGVCLMVLCSNLFLRARFRKMRDFYLLGYGFAATGTLGIVIVLSNGDAAQYYPAAFPAILIFSVSVVVPRFKIMIGITITAIAWFSFAAIFGHTDPNSLIANGMLLLICAFVAVIGSFAREKLERQAWLKDQHLALMTADAVKSRDAAIKANRATNRLLANVSHELRTPMNAILGFSEMMNSEIYGKIEPARYRDYVQNIHYSGSILLSNINDLLDYSRIHADKFGWTDERFSLLDITEKALVTCRASNPNRIVELNNKLPDGKACIFGDASRLSQGIINLVGNALKFSNETDRVTVVLQAEETGVRVAVTDRGTGIETDIVRQIVEPFSQANEDCYSAEKGGLGLGLAITTEIMNRFGGALDIDSVVGQGTTASLLIPSERLMPCGLELVA